MADRPGRSIFAGAAAVGLVGVFAALAALGVADKSATFDENVHAPAGITYLQQRDYRINPEHPVLWKYWAALPNLGRAYEMRAGAWAWDEVPENLSRQWDWAILTMYRAPANHPGVLLQRSRWMMILLAMPLGLLIALWSWRLGGATAGIIALFGFALDPNFLAHAALVTNDVPFALMMLLCAGCAWRAGNRLTWPNAAALVLAVAVTINIKYSGLLLGPIIGLLLVVRAMLPGGWTVLGHNLTGRWSRLLVVVALGGGMIAGTWAITWASYGFRYRAGDGITMRFDPMLDIEKRNRFLAEHPGWQTTMTQEDFDRWDKAYRPSAPSRFCLWMRDRKILPEPFVYGVLHVYANALLRRTYLLGEVRSSGWWYYFPLAMLFKTPTATLCAVVVAMCAALAGMERRGQGDKPPRTKGGADSPATSQPDPLVTSSCCHTAWTALCLALPPALYLGQIMAANLNLGLRHALPVYPFLFIGIGLALGRLWRTGRAAGKILVIVLALGLAAESLAALPDYLPFFNAPSIALAGGDGKLELLGDSNLDWGQDLPALAKWQKAHPDEELYLSYFGQADPAWYDIKYHNLPFGFSYGPKPEFPPGPGVIAISASNLQGIYVDRFSPQGQFLISFRKRQPIAILGGGSIYLYRWK